MKIFSKSLIAAAVLAASATTANAAEFEVSASVGVSNFYLFRGADLGDGSAQVWGDLSATYGSAYAGIWSSSGDDSLGNEYDLYAGYAGEVLGVSYDAMVVGYMYPDELNGNSSTNFGDFSEGILTLGYGPISYTHVKVIAGGSGTSYQSYDLALGDFTLTYGDHKPNLGTEDHFSVAYAYNDNLAFTVVLPISAEDEPSKNASDPLFNVALSLPIE